MDCACIYVDDYDHPDFYRSEDRKAIKQHKCCECGKEISVGEIYEHAAGKWDGVFECFKTCSVCLDLRSVFFCNGFEFTFLREKLWEHILDSDGQISSDCILDLEPESRSIVFDMIQEAWKDHDED